jgi:hypothetical protein
MMFWLERHYANATRAVRHATPSMNRRRSRSLTRCCIPLSPSPVKKKSKGDKAAAMSDDFPTAAPAADGSAAPAADGSTAPAADGTAQPGFRLPLEKPLCDNTTKFSKFIYKHFPLLRKRIGQCAAHLTGIAWQKRLHQKYSKNQNVYRTFYMLLVMHTRCSLVALSNVLQRKMIAWVRARGETRAADWLKEYWTGERGNRTLAHGGVGGTNNNNSTEGRWGGFRKAVSGTSGSTNGLQLKSVVPATLSYLSDVSKEQASY